MMEPYCYCCCCRRRRIKQDWYRHISYGCYEEDHRRVLLLLLQELEQEHSNERHLHPGCPRMRMMMMMMMMMLLRRRRRIIII